MNPEVKGFRRSSFRPSRTNASSMHSTLKIQNANDSPQSAWQLERKRRFVCGRADASRLAGRQKEPARRESVRHGDGRNDGFVVLVLNPLVAAQVSEGFGAPGQRSIRLILQPGDLQTGVEELGLTRSRALTGFDFVWQETGEPAWMALPRKSALWWHVPPRSRPADHLLPLPVILAEGWRGGAEVDELMLH